MTVWERGLQDVRSGLAARHVWLMLATNDISRRYRRSRIGQLWLTISMGAMIVGMGYVFAAIFKTETATYMPFLAVSLVAWSFISQSLNESCTAFMDNEGFIKQLPFARFTYVMRTILRNLIVMAHNALIIPLVMLFYGTPLNLTALLSFFGLALVILNLGWIGYVLAIISARFRDVPQIVASVTQVMLFLTPVMYKPRMLPDDHFVILYNPASYLLAVVRDPILGTVPPMHSYLVVIGIAFVGWALALVFAGRYSHRVPYWM